MIVNFWCAPTEPTMKTSFTETVRCGWKLVSGSCLNVYKNGVQRTSAHWALPSQFKAFNYLESSTHIYIYLFGRYFDKSDKESKPQKIKEKLSRKKSSNSVSDPTWHQRHKFASAWSTTEVSGKESRRSLSLELSSLGSSTKHHYSEKHVYA